MKNNNETAANAPLIPVDRELISKTVLDQLLDLDILSVIQNEGVVLKKTAIGFECRCPFHDGKTPAFKVLPDKGIAHCFECGESWNTITFIMDRRTLKFVEACHYLSTRYGVK